MSSAPRTRTVRLLVRIAISGLALALFAMHIAGQPRFEVIDRIENYLYDVRIRLTMPGTVDEVCGKSHLYQYVGLQTDYSSQGRGVITPRMIETVLGTARG